MSDLFKKSSKLVLASLGVQQTVPFRFSEAAVMSDSNSVDVVLESLGSDCWEVGAQNCPAIVDGNINLEGVHTTVCSSNKCVYGGGGYM